jgi:hypothetical protein
MRSAELLAVLPLTDPGLHVGAGLLTFRQHMA